MSPQNRVCLGLLAITLVGWSSGAAAQTYGTMDYGPGSWKPEELPKELSAPKPYDPRDLSGVWSTPTTAGYFERHSLNDRWVETKDKRFRHRCVRTLLHLP
jgi:hypothetical protein